MRRLMNFILAGFLLLNCYGCIAVVAGAAGGAGTAAWLSGKMVQQVNAPYDRSVQAVKDMLVDNKLLLVREIDSKTATQIRSQYTDGRKIWIDVFPVTTTSSRIEVRVGAFADKVAADSVLKKIVSHL